MPRAHNGKRRAEREQATAERRLRQLVERFGQNGVPAPSPAQRVLRQAGQRRRAA